MKTKTIRLTAFTIILLLVITNVTVAQTKEKKSKGKKTDKAEIITLFNGKDLGNWVFYLKG